MINFEGFVYGKRALTPAEWDESAKAREKQIAAVKAAMNGIGQNKYDLGLRLIEMYEAKDFATTRGWQTVRDTGKTGNGVIYEAWCSSYSFFQECETLFGMDKSQVSRYMNIVDEFGDRANGLKPEWSEFGWSQLVELLSMTPEEREQVKPSWTVKQIREYKAKLVATSQPEKKAPKEKPNRDYYISRSDFSDWNYSNEYKRFYGYSVCTLCGKLLDAENEVKRLKAELEEVKGAKHEA